MLCEGISSGHVTGRGRALLSTSASVQVAAAAQWEKPGRGDITFRLSVYRADLLI